MFLTQCSKINRVPWSAHYRIQVDHGLTPLMGTISVDLFKPSVLQLHLIISERESLDRSELKSPAYRRANSYICFFPYGPSFLGRQYQSSSDRNCRWTEAGTGTSLVQGYTLESGTDRQTSDRCNPTRPISGELSRLIYLGL